MALFAPYVIGASSSMVTCGHLVRSLHEIPEENTKLVVRMEALSDDVVRQFPFDQNLQFFVNNLGTAHISEAYRIARRAAESNRKEDVVFSTPDGATLKYYAKEDVIILVRDRKLLGIFRIAPNTPESRNRILLRDGVSYRADKPDTATLFARMAGVGETRAFRSRLWVGGAVKDILNFVPDVLSLKFHSHRDAFTDLRDEKKYEARAIQFIESVRPFQYIVVRQVRSPNRPPKIRIIKYDLETQELAVLSYSVKPQQYQVLTYYRTHFLSFLMDFFYTDREYQPGNEPPRRAN